MAGKNDESRESAHINFRVIRCFPPLAAAGKRLGPQYKWK